jgi:hypothetical protein
MDPTKEDSLTIDLSDVLEKFKQENDTLYQSYPGYGAVPNASVTDTITLNSGSGYTYSNVTLAPNIYSNISSPYTISSGYTGSPKIRLDGEGADIEVNGWSLIDSIKKIEERLNLLTPNTKLEEEWEELRELGNKYRELEQHIKDKMKVWDKLKSMPPPEL